MADVVLSPQILRWRVQEPEVQERRCLVEVQRDPEGQLLVFLAVILPRETRLRREDLPQVAPAVWALLDERAADPATTRWFLRHGEFSTYDPTDGETLTEVPLSSEGNEWTHDEDRERLVPAAEQAVLLTGVLPVETALSALHA